MVFALSVKALGSPEASPFRATRLRWASASTSFVWDPPRLADQPVTSSLGLTGGLLNLAEPGHAGLGLLNGNPETPERYAAEPASPDTPEWDTAEIPGSGIRTW